MLRALALYLDGNMKRSCPFCFEVESRIVIQNREAFAIYDKYPVSKGHLLIVSKSHKGSFFDLKDIEQNDMLNLIRDAKEYLESKYAPDGYNIGTNIGFAAGQTINHCHIHIIPRYEGDSENRVGGVRKVINGEGRY